LDSYFSSSIVGKRRIDSIPDDKTRNSIIGGGGEIEVDQISHSILQQSRSVIDSQRSRSVLRNGSSRLGNISTLIELGAHPDRSATQIKLQGLPILSQHISILQEDDTAKVLNSSKPEEILV